MLAVDLRDGHVPVKLGEAVLRRTRIHGSSVLCSQSWWHVKGLSAAIARGIRLLVSVHVARREPRFIQFSEPSFCLLCVCYANVRSEELSTNYLISLARPTGFEPVTSAFGGPTGAAMFLGAEPTTAASYVLATHRFR